jgi:hypothetical protein
MHAPPDRRPLFVADSRLARAAALGLAAIATAIWLWNCACQFPAMPWNDIRVAPAVALARGWSVFPTAEHGVINTWTYGPLPLLYLWPAAWSSSAAGALQIAAGLNLALILTPLALVCFAGPARGDPATIGFGRITAFLLCIVVWPAEYFALYYADSLALTCGLLGNLLLLRNRTTPALWLVALLATAAVASKQTALGIPLAQVIWLGLIDGWRPAVAQIGRCIAAGLVVGGLAIATFGWPGLWFILVELPANFKWFPDPLKRLAFVAPQLALHLGLPAALMAWQHRAFRSRPELLLPALAWVCAIPLGVMALLKLGGRTNTLYSFPLWLPFVVTAALTADLAHGLRRWIPLGAAIAAAALACLLVLEAPRLTLRPQVGAYREAEQFTRQLHGRVWFPFHPLITLYSEDRYYHDEDGIFVRQTTRGKISPEQAAAHLPPAMQVIALRRDWSDWGVARGMMPPGARRSTVGGWDLWYASIDSAPSR